MRTGKIVIDGEEHLLCFSLRVMQKCTEQFGSVEKIDEALEDDDQWKEFENSIWILAAMMEGADRYAKKKGIQNADLLSIEDIYDLMDLNELGLIKESIFKTISDGSITTVEVEPPKNQETTQVKETA